MLKFLDVLLAVVHLAIILFNLFGWISKVTRKAHFIAIVLTATSWLLLGIPFGMGYCPFTDWQWQVKERLGERNLPNNFIEYFAEKALEQNVDAGLVNTVIGVCFALAALLSVYVNFILPRIRKRSHV